MDLNFIMSEQSNLRPTVLKGHCETTLKKQPYCRLVCKHVGVVCTHIAENRRCETHLTQEVGGQVN